ncbi:MAG: putative Ig domain-containing protein, partial [Cyanobacteria bacterium J06553_1]
TGALSWTTATADIANHDVVIQVSDGRGGLSEQSYTLAVLETPPNRPPNFTSTPVVDAFINQPYTYDADAVDPDQDPLTYELVQGPDGLTVDPNTGLVEWTPPPVVLLGDTILGQIGVPGERDEFSFSGALGQTLYFDPLRFSGNARAWNLKVFNPDDEQLISTDLSSSNAKLLTLSETGNYRITIDVDGDATGAYGFSVIDTALTPVVPTDTVVSGELSPGSEDDIYRFVGNADQKVFLDAIAKNGSLDWVLYDPGNTEIASSSFFGDLELTLPLDGEYTLALRGTSDFSEVVTYSFEIVTPDELDMALQLNTTVTATIGEKGEKDIYTFSLSERSFLYFDSLTDEGSLNWTLSGPAGVEIDRLSFNRADFTVIEAIAGDYSLVIDGTNEHTGDYGFRLWNIADAAEFTPGTAVSGELNPAAGVNLHRFEVTAGEQFFFDTQGSSGNLDGWRLLNPFGRDVFDQGFFDVDTTRLEQPGTYTLLIVGRRFSTGTTPYTFNVQPVPTAV